MEKKFLKLPLRFNTVSEDRIENISFCSELESIDQNLELILTTCPGEHKFNRDFGCRIWDMDFETVTLRKKWQEEFSFNIRNAIQDFEPRLSDIDVSVHVNEVSNQDSVTKITAIRKKAILLVSGNLVSTGKQCGFRYVLYLGPLAME